MDLWTDRYDKATFAFETGDYIAAAELLADLVADHPDDTAVRLLLARAYYHSAQLRRAEEQARAVLDRCPVEGYAHLLLGRALQRQSRGDEAGAHMRLARAMGVST